MADSNAAKKIKEESPADSGKDAGEAKDRKALILMILVVVNSLAFVGVGAGLFMYSKATKQAIKSETEIAETTDKEQAGDKKDAADEEAKLVALDSFYVNLSGSEGYRLLKVTMSLDVENVQTQDEILKRQAMVRDTILVLISSKSYSEVAGENAHQKLKDEIMDTVNSFLTKGKIKKILFTEFIFN